MEIQDSSLTKIVFGGENVIGSRAGTAGGRRPLTGVSGSSKRKVAHSVKIHKFTLQINTSRPSTSIITNIIPTTINSNSDASQNGKVFYPPIIQQSEFKFPKRLVIADMKTHHSNHFPRQSNINSAPVLEKILYSNISRDSFQKPGLGSEVSIGFLKPQTPAPDSRAYNKPQGDLEHVPRFRITSARKNASHQEYQNRDPNKRQSIQIFASPRKLISQNQISAANLPVQNSLVELKKESGEIAQDKGEIRQLDDSSDDSGKDSATYNENQNLKPNDNNEIDSKGIGSRTTLWRNDTVEKLCGEDTQKNEGGDQLMFSCKRPKPNVSAESWVLLNVKTGEVISDKNSCEVREIASLTKIMTAIVALDFVEKFDIQAQDFLIRVSSLAPLMNGTSAKLREGETLSLWDMLHALMLPSGNDAAVAIAESIGRRLMNEVLSSQKNDDESKPAPSKNPIWYFVSQMNSKAKELGMKNTKFANPHGLNEKDNLSTAVDVAILSAFAMKKGAIRTIVKKKNYECAIVQSNRVLRGISWENTNKLLNHGYDGLKTGITPSAGPCLASSLHRGDSRHLICVVLNCGSPEQRFSDSRKLMEYGMRLLLHQDKGDLSANY